MLHNFSYIKLILFFSVMPLLFPFIDKPHASAHLTGLSVTATSIFLQWTDPNNASYAQTTFTVNYYPFSNHQLEKNGTAAIAQFNLTGLHPATVYVIRIIAVNKYFEGDLSNQITQKTREAGMSRVH